ncbi:hypothetical protein ABFS82_03G125000 [Erythranthe guttata]
MVNKVSGAAAKFLFVVVLLCFLLVSSGSGEGRAAVKEGKKDCYIAYPSECVKQGISVCTVCVKFAGLYSISCNTLNGVSNCICLYHCDDDHHHIISPPTPTSSSSSSPSPITIIN